MNTEQAIGAPEQTEVDDLAQCVIAQTLFTNTRSLAVSHAILGLHRLQLELLR